MLEAIYLLSRTAEYALQAAAVLAAHAPASLTREQVAAATTVPPEYLYKVLQILTRAGIVQALRGVRGGYRMARPSAEVSLLDVVRAVSPPRHELRRMDERLEAAFARFEASLAELRLADLGGRSPATTTLLIRPALSRAPNRRRPAPTPSPVQPVSDDWAVWTARAG